MGVSARDLRRIFACNFLGLVISREGLRRGFRFRHFRLERRILFSGLLGSG